ncbi:unnamed protein product, partial [Mesorhabditis belari]|uniref:Uncharacterized protein n=1 Tax=Mesorhabditis belari TaxID=2138241 RepID=A0AAF3JAV9_9BILA
MARSLNCWPERAGTRRKAFTALHLDFSRDEPNSIIDVDTNLLNKSFYSSFWTLKLVCSPPAEWTFCDIDCGSGDQAIDEANARENARDDIFEALTESYNTLGLAPPSIQLIYHPKSININRGNHPPNGPILYIPRLINGTLSRMNYEVEITINVFPPLADFHKKQLANFMLHNLSLKRKAKFRERISFY